MTNPLTSAGRTQVQMSMAGYLPVGCFRKSAIKSIQEAVDVSKKIIRGEELISVAHPNFRAPPRAEASTRYYV